MPGNPQEHFEYTVNEWSGPFIRFIDALEDIKVCFDVGANAGGFCKVISDRFPDVKLVAFEPIANNYDALLELVPEAWAYRAAVQYGTRETRMFWRGGNIGAYFTEEVNAGDDKYYCGETVPTTTLEEWTHVFGDPDLVKLDVEGAEENIIEHSTLLRTTKYVIVEWHPDHVDPLAFFARHLPKHKILISMENKQFLLCLD